MLMQMAATNISTSKEASLSASKVRSIMNSTVVTDASNHASELYKKAHGLLRIRKVHVVSSITHASRYSNLNRSISIGNRKLNTGNKLLQGQTFILAKLYGKNMIKPVQLDGEKLRIILKHYTIAIKEGIHDGHYIHNKS